MKDVVFAKVKTFKEFKNFIKNLNIKADTFIIKPNWVEPSEGQYTEVIPLRWLFECLDGKKVVMESHTAWRNKLLLETGEVIVNSDNVEQKKDFLRKNDNWFLESTGLKGLLEEYGVEYINITEEVWGGESVDSKIVREIVENKYPSVMCEELYSVVPKKIFELRGGKTVFIDLAKIKTDEDFAMTLSTKNLFGLIPDPKRSPKYHDHERKKLPHAILDINKIYRALFKTVFINEGIFTAIDGPSPSRGRLKKNLNLIVGGENSVDVDLVTAKLVGIDPKVLSKKYLGLSGKIFGLNAKLLDQIPDGFFDKLVYNK